MLMRASRWMVLCLVVGCASTTPEAPSSPSLPAATASAASEGVPETRALSLGVHWVRNSAEYEALIRQTFRLAGDRLQQLVADRAAGTWAISADADETILDNSLYAKELILADKDSTDDLWDAWVARRAAQPMPGAIDFLNRVHSLGGRIAIVTNRIADHCPDTRANFRAFEIPFDVMLCREDNRQKEPRWRMIETGDTPAGLPPMEIMLWLGDNIRDFPDLDQTLRFEDAAAFRAFGDRYFVFPNPIYGSWQGNPHD